MLQGDNKELIYKIDSGRIKPSKSLQDSIAKMLKGNREFIMLDEQKVVYEEILEERKTIQMDLSRFPGSPARMILLGVLERLPKQPIRLEELSLFFEVGKNATEVKCLLERDLSPAIPFVESNKTLQIRGLGVYPWLTREPLP